MRRSEFLGVLAALPVVGGVFKAKRRYPTLHERMGYGDLVFNGEPMYVDTRVPRYYGYSIIQRLNDMRNA